MRIAFDHQIFGWQKYGGISRYYCELASELANGSEQTVAVISPFYINEHLRKASARLQVIGTKVPGYPKAGRPLRALNSMLVAPLLRSFHPDIVHETYYSTTHHRIKKAKRVLTVFDMIHERFSDMYSPLDLVRKEKADAVAHADHVICISAQTQQDLVNLLGVDPEKTTVVHLGYRLKAGSRTITLPVHAQRPFLLFVGIRVGYKNFEGMLKAYAASSVLRSAFDIICFGGGAFSYSECALIQKLGLSADHLHQVAGGDGILAEFYRKATAFVYPSLYEGFGLPPLEAMSFDCPVVCSGASSIPEVVGDAGAFFDPCDIDAIRSALELVVSDSAIRRTLIERGRKRIQQFSWARCAQETLDVYRKVMI